jgi:glycosyltransferase involved in cell wall biosynthesis
MIHTASCDNFLNNQGIQSYFASLLKNLSRQTLKEFELIYIDTFYNDNKVFFDSLNSGLPFILKHVPIHEKHRYWYDKGYVYISAAKNTGLLYADGELVVTCDDAEFFPDNLLERYWKHYNHGNFMISMHKRMKSIKSTNGVVDFPIDGEIYINDHRLKNLNKEIHYHRNGSWAFAGTSFSLKDAIILNGFNEKMDGCKSLEDCDFGERLVQLGVNFLLDRNGFIYILDHSSYTDYNEKTNWSEVCGDCQEEDKTDVSLMQKKIENFIAVENYGVLLCGRELYEMRANSNKITHKHLEIIRRETLKYRGFDILSDENKEKLNIWLGIPNFDLNQERIELRKNPNWRW